jgi:hypothetical protein
MKLTSEVKMSCLSPVLVDKDVVIVWKWKFVRDDGCDDVYDRMILDWKNVEKFGICRMDWIGAVDKFTRRGDSIVQFSLETVLYCVMTTKEDPIRMEIVRDSWVQKNLKEDFSIISRIQSLGFWSDVTSFLWKQRLPQREMSVYNLSFTECVSGAKIGCRQTSDWLLTGVPPLILEEQSKMDGILFCGAYPHIQVGNVILIKMRCTSGIIELYRIRSLSPLEMRRESVYEQGGWVATIRLLGPVPVLHCDVASLIAVSRMVSCFTKSTILRQQSVSINSRDTAPSLKESVAILKRLSNTTMRCNFSEVQNLQESYHFTARYVDVLATLLRPKVDEDATKGATLPGIFYAGCGLGREVIAMAMNNPTQRFVANDLPADLSVSCDAAVQQARALRSLAVGFGLINAHNLVISAASMCSAYSATMQTTASGALYSTVTSIDIFRGTLRHALFAGVQIICMLTQIAKPNRTLAGCTFDEAVVSSIEFTLGGRHNADWAAIRRTVATNIKGGGVTVYDFSGLPTTQRRLVVSSILAHTW